MLPSNLKKKENFPMGCSVFTSRINQQSRLVDSENEYCHRQSHY